MNWRRLSKWILVLLVPVLLGSSAWLPHRRKAFRSSDSATYSLYTNYVTAGLRNNYSGYVGMVFTNNAQITAKQIGRWVVSGNSGTHELIIVKWSDGSVVASNSISTSGLTAGQFNYVDITPAILQAATVYAIVSKEASGGDQWYNVTTASPTAALSTGDYGSACYGTSVAALTYEAAQTRPYVPTDIKYTPSP